MRPFESIVTIVGLLIVTTFPAIALFALVAAVPPPEDMLFSANGYNMSTMEFEGTLEGLSGSLIKARGTVQQIYAQVKAQHASWDPSFVIFPARPRPSNIATTLQDPDSKLPNKLCGPLIWMLFGSC